MPTNEPIPDTPPGGRASRRRKVWLPKNTKLTQKLLKELDLMMAYAPPERLARNLRNLLLMHLGNERDHPLYFDDLVADLYVLFQFLDLAADEMKKE